MFNGNGLSLADIAAVTGGNRNNDGWGDGNGWWIIIILFAIFGGWGNNGNNGGNCRNNCCNGGETVVVPYPMGAGFGGWGAYDAASLQRGFDNQTVINKLNGIENGICSLGYDQLAQMNGINQTVTQTGWGIQQQLQNNAIAQMQSDNALSRQLGDCCCENRAAIAQVRFDMATEACATRNQMSQGFNSVLQNQDRHACEIQQTIKDGFTALAMEAKDQQIASLQQQVNRATTQAELQGVANYVINAVNPRTQPSYLTCNPNTGSVLPQAALDQLMWAQAQRQNQHCCQPDPCCCR